MKKESNSNLAAILLVAGALLGGGTAAAEDASLPTQWSVEQFNRLQNIIWLDAAKLEYGTVQNVRFVVPSTVEPNAAIRKVLEDVGLE